MERIETRPTFAEATAPSIEGKAVREAVSECGQRASFIKKKNASY